MSQVVMARKARAMQLAKLRNEKNSKAGITSTETKNFSGNFNGYLTNKNKCCGKTVKGVGGNQKSSENHFVTREIDCDKSAKVRTYTTTTFEKKIINGSDGDICKVGNRVVGQSYAVVGNPVTRTRCEVVRPKRTISSGDRIRDLKNKVIMENRDWNEQNITPYSNSKLSCS